jgi:DNA-binding NtrC family response regulator
MGTEDDSESYTLAHRKLVPNPRGASFAVVVVEGAEAGKSVILAAGSAARVLVGQSPVCEVGLSDRSVSRRHLSLELVEGEERDHVRLRDLGSTNGTTVGGLTVVEAKLFGGERIRLGSTTLELRRAPVRADSLPATTLFGKMLGASPQVRRLYPMCERLARSAVPVLIEGETGTGKEVLAEALHDAGPRASGPFVVFDCTTVAPNLIESVLFGHEKGSFTGASDARRGVFEVAHGGTLFIDEIGDLDLPLQAKLLRAIERSAVCRLGAEKWREVDVRIICATRRDLDQAIQRGAFRDDLFFRIAVGRIELPPLRDRSGDIPLLAQHFWHQSGGQGEIPNELVSRLEQERWPGNIRELRNTVARFVALGDLADEVPSLQRAQPHGDLVTEIIDKVLPFAQSKQLLLEAFERRYVEAALARHGNSVTRAAEASGLARRYFQILRARQRED